MTNAKITAIRTVLNETAMSFSTAARALPGKVHVSTLHRWRTRGIQGVRLEALRVGGRWVTSAEALDRFFKAITLAADPSQERMPGSQEASGADGDDHNNVHVHQVDPNKVDQELNRLGF